ncbi:Pimeloyl-ACP methyl ester carboxylesterase [Actinacidiphila yanglinensis]|uniref:Pimeloyl-ACP methyl ester carboxylesterase n=1 Tax=Actinacidiphila yanglinensis TaxID=310779 RepID=A0A1H6DW21_9ACTN|nr:alpha/beta hydrolase [Actinacidiphila yanglinensis]SEG89527.1 Pimeloyl-ACP methyl ester carboxylesterase [Actinacidiphila yanglinensis]
MPTVVIDGITTRYETAGSGPPLLMFSPGGFDSTLESWRTVGVYRRLRLLEQLAAAYTCITFDRRESGRSGGRVERIGWSDYVRQGVGLLDHLGIGQAYLMGGCVGCSTVAAVAVAHPERVLGMVLYSPAGGVKYRMKQHARFVTHLAYADEHGLARVAELAAGTDAGFSADPRVGPWASVLRQDAAFATRYAAMAPDRYRLAAGGTARLLFDRDTVPGPEPEDLLALDVPALIVPGQDESHAPSAARYLQECLPRAEFWDVPVADQTEHTAPSRVLEFLATA